MWTVNVKLKLGGWWPRCQRFAPHLLNVESVMVLFYGNMFFHRSHVNMNSRQNMIISDLFMKVFAIFSALKAAQSEDLQFVKCSTVYNLFNLSKESRDHEGSEVLNVPLFHLDFVKKTKSWQLKHFFFSKVIVKHKIGPFVKWVNGPLIAHHVPNKCRASCARFLQWQEPF